MTAVSTLHATLSDREAIERFLIREAMLLDDRRFEEWRDLFVDEGTYWVPLRPDQPSPETEASLFYDDKRLMQTRIERLRHPRIHSQTPPHRTCHLIGNVVVLDVDEQKRECVARSSLMMADYRLRVQRNFAAKVTHRLRREIGWADFQIVSKRVDLINCDDAFELIAVPF